MTTVNIAVTLQAEYNGAGVATGNVWISGKKFTVPTGDLPAGQVTDGSTSTKYKIDLQAHLQDTSNGASPQSPFSGQSLVLHHPSTGKKVTSTLT